MYIVDSFSAPDAGGLKRAKKKAKTNKRQIISHKKYSIQKNLPVIGFKMF
jgi:hypothetical protein